jgi:hypothetical protein
MLNMYAVQEAGQESGTLIGIKHPVYGRNGYTSFVPPDSEYDPALVAMHLREARPDVPPVERSGPPSAWRYPALETLQEEVARFPAPTRKIFWRRITTFCFLPRTARGRRYGISASAGLRRWRMRCRGRLRWISCGRRR